MSATHSLLVVDDDPLTCTRVKAYFEREGYCVRVAANGDEMWDSLRQHPTDVVLLDIGLPDMDGYEVARRLTLLGQRGLSIVAVTGYDSDEALRRSGTAGLDDHIVKPCRDEQLAMVLSKTMARALARTA